MDLRQVKSIGIQRARSGFSDVLKEAEAGIHFLILRFDQPIAALMRHDDYLRYVELARRDALTRALLQGKGYDPKELSEEVFLDLLATHVKEDN